MHNIQPPATPAEHLEQTTNLAHALVDVCTASGLHHRVATEALLAAFASIAICNPCCARSSAHVARRTADLVDSQTPHAPAGAPIH